MVQLVQLPLNIQLRDAATLDNFYVDDNSTLLNYLTTFYELSAHNLYIWGKTGTGRSHLLQALGHLAQQQGLTFAYLPLQECVHYSPDLLENYENFSVILLDDIDSIAHSTEWQIALFHLYNRVQDLQHRWVCTANVAPAQLPLSLADLQSRLNASIIFQTQELSEANKAALLQWRAEQRGLVLSDEVVNYLLHHLPRDLPQLLTVLDDLDRAALAAKRKITIPFIKSLSEYPPLK